MIHHTPDWRDEANCATTDPDLFVLERAESSAPAKKICANCDVREQCLQYALTHKVSGVYGGLTNFERRMIRERNAA